LTGVEIFFFPPTLAGVEEKVLFFPFPFFSVAPKEEGEEGRLSKRRGGEVLSPSPSRKNFHPLSSL